MKQLIQLVLGGLVILLMVPSAKASYGSMCTSYSELQISGGGDPTPWPWGLEVKMAWSSMSGVWQPMAMDCNSFFVFRAGRPTPSGERLMTITQFDPVNCRVLAKGAGYEYNNIVYASMVSDSKTFDLTVRVFNEADIKANMKAIVEQAKRKVVVVHMYPKGNWEARVSYEVEKVRNTSDVSCKNLEK